MVILPRYKPQGGAIPQNKNNLIEINKKVNNDPLTPTPTKR